MLKPVAFPSYASALAISLLLITGCDEKIKVNTIIAMPQGDAQAPVIVVSCSGQDDGMECGNGRHCLAEKCVFNTCGDGIAAEQEECDDGNALSNDGCTPSCRLELESCPDGMLKIVGQECPTADAGPGERPLCPMITSMSINGDRNATSATAKFGETISLEATAIGSSEQQRWIYRGRGALSFSGLTASFYCSERVDPTPVHLLLTRPDCPNSVARADVVCDVPDDASVPATSDGGLSDGGVDASISDGGSDAGAGDAGPQDASATDGSTDSGGAPNPFGSAACESCMRDNCTLYEGLPLFGPCIDNANGASFSKLCTDAFACSRASADQCAVASLGSAACFCGAGVGIDSCATNATGNCKNEWTAAAECSAAPSPNDCVLTEFTNEAKPSGVANYMLECRKNLCLTQCP